MNLRCIVIGNSVAIRVRGGTRKENYADLLAVDGFYCKNVGKAGTMITEAFYYLDDEIICSKYDYVIINFGIVEVYSRSLTRGFNNIFVNNKYNNSVLGREYRPRLKIKAINFLKPIYWAFQFCRNVVRYDFTWLSVENYIEALLEIISIIKKETNSKIILLGLHEICCSKDINFNKINKRIRKINEHYKLLESDDRISYLDVESEIKSARSINSPDGIHYSDEFHLKISSLLKKCMEEK